MQPEGREATSVSCPSGAFRHMELFAPGQTAVVTIPDLPVGQSVGFQLRKAATDSVSIARTTAGVVERPTGLGNYVINFVTPAEGDIYLLVADWSNGVLAPETSKVIEIKVTTEVIPGSSGMGAIADYVQMHLGGESWDGLKSSARYGEPFIQLAIDAVKRRVSTTAISTVDEASLDPIVQEYIGILAGLELTTALRDYWANQIISQSVGDSPAELVTYPNRAALVDDLRDDLMRKRGEIQPLALSLLTTPRLRTAEGPDIDEDDDCRVTADPRSFPREENFPYNQPPLTTGVRI